MFCLGWCRAWTLIFFNKGVRNALETLLKVLTRLGPLAGLMVSFFLIHFFVFQSMAVGEAASNGWGTGSNANISDALYDLFCLLTTVNHPDTMMWLVDIKPIAFFVIMSYMFFTSIIGLNLLLGIVYGEYVSILNEDLEGEASLRAQMVMTAFEIYTANQDEADAHMTTVDLKAVLEEVVKGDNTMSGEGDENYVEMIVRMIDGKSERGAKTSTQDDRIDREDMHEVVVLFNAPFKFMSANKPARRFKDAIRALENQDDIDAMNELPIDKWCASHPKFYYYVFEQGAGAKCCGLGSLNPWNDKSILVQLRNQWFFFYILFCVFNVADETYDSGALVLLFISGSIQIFYVGIKFVAEIRPWQPYHFFNPIGQDGPANLSNLGLAICLWAEFLTRCNDKDANGNTGCFKTGLQRSSGMATIVFTAAGKFFQVCNFVTETRSVAQLFTAVVRTLPTLGPHFGLFLAIYYGFSGMGIAFFCGMCKQSVLEGGPGYWGQNDTPTAVTQGNNQPANYVMQQAKATSSPWDQTMYGGNPYYYNLNYDGFPNAIASLYVVMIQNNWNVAADGPIEVTNGNFRWFFVVFTVAVAFVMINVLVGAIIDALSAVRDDMAMRDAGDKSDLQQSLESRLTTTVAPSGELYSENWECGDLQLHDELSFDAALTKSFADQSETGESKAMLVEKEATKAALLAELAELKMAK